MQTARRSLDPKQDYVFWRLFSAEQNRALLVDLLSAVLRPGFSHHRAHAAAARAGKGLCGRERDLSADPIAIVEADREHNARYAIWLDKTLTRDDALIEGRARGLEEGRAEGVAATLLTVLDARGFAITDEQRARIRACKDLQQQLEQWTRRAVAASSAEKLFG